MESQREERNKLAALKSRACGIKTTAPTTALLSSKTVIMTLAVLSFSQIVHCARLQASGASVSTTITTLPTTTTPGPLNDRPQTQSESLKMSLNESLAKFIQATEQATVNQRSHQQQQQHHQQQQQQQQQDQRRQQIVINNSANHKQQLQQQALKKISCDELSLVVLAQRVLNMSASSGAISRLIECKQDNLLDLNHMEILERERSNGSVVTAGDGDDEDDDNGHRINSANKTTTGTMHDGRRHHGSDGIDVVASREAAFVQLVDNQEFLPKELHLGAKIALSLLLATAFLVATATLVDYQTDCWTRTGDYNGNRHGANRTTAGSSSSSGGRLLFGKKDSKGSLRDYRSLSMSSNCSSNLFCSTISVASSSAPILSSTTTAAVAASATAASNAHKANAAYHNHHQHHHHGASCMTSSSSSFASSPQPSQPTACTNSASNNNAEDDSTTTDTGPKHYELNLQLHLNQQPTITSHVDNNNSKTLIIHMPQQCGADAHKPLSTQQYLSPTYSDCHTQAATIKATAAAEAGTGQTTTAALEKNQVQRSEMSADLITLARQVLLAFSLRQSAKQIFDIQPPANKQLDSAKDIECCLRRRKQRQPERRACTSTTPSDVDFKEATTRNQQQQPSVAADHCLSSRIFIESPQAEATVDTETETETEAEASTPIPAQTPTLEPVTSKSRQNESVNSLHGLRFLSMIWVIVIHSYNFALRWMFFSNTTTLDRVYKSYPSQLIANGSFACDSFFFAGGFLLPYLAFNSVSAALSSTTKTGTQKTSTSSSDSNSKAKGQQVASGDNIQVEAEQKRLAATHQHDAGEAGQTGEDEMVAGAQSIARDCYHCECSPSSLLSALIDVDRRQHQQVRCDDASPRTSPNCCSSTTGPPQTSSSTSPSLPQLAILVNGGGPPEQQQQQHLQEQRQRPTTAADENARGNGNTNSDNCRLAAASFTCEQAQHTNEQRVSGDHQQQQRNLEQQPAKVSHDSAHGQFKSNSITGQFTLKHIFANILHRYVRMMPLMMAIIGLCSTLLRYLGEGPLWNDSTMMYDSWCRKNWWINALFLHNFVNRENMCLSHSWYSAVDLQLFLLGQLILFALAKSRRLGLALLVFAIICSQLITLSLTLAHHLPPVPLVSSVNEQTMNLYYGEIYIKPYCRASPYLIGILLAYLMRTTRLGQLKLARWQVLMGWSCSLVTFFTIIMAMQPAMNGRTLSELESALYSALSRPLWALATGWMIFACITKQGGFIDKILSARCFVPLSRLTYPAFLIHPIIMALFYGSRQASFHFSHYLMLYLILGNIVITYASAFILAALFELPLISIERTISRRFFSMKG